MRWHVSWHMVTARQRGHAPHLLTVAVRRDYRDRTSFNPTSERTTVITLGLILLILGLVLSVSILTTIGGILLVVGIILALIGRTSPVGGRAHWY